MKFATLGPAGSNHDLNTQRYIAFHGLKDVEIVYIKSFLDAIDQMTAGEIDFMIQVCAHPDVADTIEKRYREVFLVDCFIGKTKAMGVLTRVEVEKPRTLAYMVATAGYFRPEDWPVRVHTLSNPETAALLLNRECDSGFTALEVAEQNPGRFRIDKVIGEVDVVWLVYGKTRTNTGAMLAWDKAPAFA
jgi:hypothetical protein